MANIFEKGKVMKSSAQLWFSGKKPFEDPSILVTGGFEISCEVRTATHCMTLNWMANPWRLGTSQLYQPPILEQTRVFFWGLIGFRMFYERP